MNEAVYLRDGDATFCKQFTKVAYGEKSGTEFSFKFGAARGEKFVVLLLGSVPKDATECDVGAMLNKLGYYRREAPGDE